MVSAGDVWGEVSGGFGLVLPVPHMYSLNFIEPLRYRARHGGSESGRASLARRSCPTA